MPMNINNNITALQAQRNFSKSQEALSKSMERLSSGLRINSAKDDAAGLAISSRFSAQIKGMNQAIRNANDASSMTMTADGAMDEITSNLQRIRDLAVQSANASYSDSDRGSMQSEAQQLIQEINRVAGNTQFNGTNLLDGTFQKSFQINPNSDVNVTINIGDMSASALGNNTLVTGGTISQANTGTSNAVTSQTLTVTGNQGNAEVAVGAGDSAKTIAENVNAVSAQTGVRSTAETTATISNVSAGKVEFSLKGANNQAVTISAEVEAPSNLSAIAVEINARSSTTNITAKADDKGNLTLTELAGNDIQIGNTTAGTGLATATVRGGDRINSGIATGPIGDGSSQAPQTVTVGGSLRLFSNESFSVATDSEGSLLTDKTQQSLLNSVADIDLGTVEGSEKAISTIDAAIDNILKNRGNLGSTQHRFDAAISNLLNVSENYTAARSRIQDTDFAVETASLTRSQILQQSGTAMLAQANSAPQQVLSLLRG